MPTLLLAVLAVYALLSGPAWGQTLCGKRATLLKGLEQNYGEHPALRGLDARGRLVELLVSPSGSWTILVTAPGRDTCMSGTGEYLELTPREPVVPGSPS